MQHVRAVACLHPSNPPCHAVLHVLSEGFCFGFLAGTLSIPLCAVCILDVLFFISFGFELSFLLLVTVCYSYCILF